jgi:hypothetical protein
MNTTASGDLRVSDADRDAALAELSEHFQAGRITSEEFDERSGRALRARTERELADLFTDLPHDHRQPRQQPRLPVTGPGENRPALPSRGLGVLIVSTVAIVVCVTALAAYHTFTIGSGGPGLVGGPGILGVLAIVFVVRRLARRR